METYEKKTVDMLTVNSVSILTQKFCDIDGIETQVGKNHRVSYVNSETGRQTLQGQQPEEVVNAVFAIWGDTPTIAEATETTEETEAVE